MKRTVKVLDRPLQLPKGQLAKLLIGNKHLLVYVLEGQQKELIVCPLKGNEPDLTIVMSVDRNLLRIPLLDVSKLVH